MRDIGFLAGYAPPKIMIRPHSAARLFHDFNCIKVILICPEQFEKTSQTDREFMRYQSALLSVSFQFPHQTFRAAEIKAQAV